MGRSTCLVLRGTTPLVTYAPFTASSVRSQALRTSCLLDHKSRNGYERDRGLSRSLTPPPCDNGCELVDQRLPCSWSVRSLFLLLAAYSRCPTDLKWLRIVEGWLFCPELTRIWIAITWYNTLTRNVRLKSPLRVSCSKLTNCLESINKLGLVGERLV